MTTLAKLINLVMNEVTVIDTGAGQARTGRLEHSPNPEMMIVRTEVENNIIHAAFSIENITDINDNQIQVTALFT